MEGCNLPGLSAELELGAPRGGIVPMRMQATASPLF